MIVRLIFSWQQAESSLEELTQGLAGLDISQSPADRNPATSTPVGGARPKVRPGVEKVTLEDEATPEPSQSAESEDTPLQTQVSRTTDDL